MDVFFLAFFSGGGFDGDWLSTDADPLERWPTALYCVDCTHRTIDQMRDLIHLHKFLDACR